MPGAFTAPPDRRQVGDVLDEHQLGVPLAVAYAGVEYARQPAQVAVEGGDFMLVAYRLQPGVEHHIVELQGAPIKHLKILAAQVERHGGAVQFVGAAQVRASLLHVVPRLFGRQGIAHGFLGQVVEVRLQIVLRGDHQRDAEYGVFGHLIEQGVDGVATLGRFSGQVAGHRRVTQAVEHHDTVGHPVEVPQPMLPVRAGLFEEQALGEVSAAGQRQFIVGVIRRITGLLVEALAILRGVAQQIRLRIEPAQQPMVDLRAIEAAGFHAGIAQAADQAFAQAVERLLAVLSALPRRALAAPVHHQADFAALPAPGQLGDRRVFATAPPDAGRTSADSSG